jgi:hypothetical protein
MSLDFGLYVDVDTGGPKTHRVWIHQGNVTNNAASIYDRAGCYDAMWSADEKLAGEIAPILRAGVVAIRAEWETFLSLVKVPEFTWGQGTAESWLGRITEILDEYATACEENPKAIVWVYR